MFANALEFVDGQARSKYLDQVVGMNSGERQRLDRLLAYSASHPDFLEVTPEFKSESARLESIGDWLGPYRLIQKIGEGGMGVVYMAEQVAPLQRRVAVKVIKPGMDSSQVLARFEAERQALAMMEHPNIARAIDVGVSDFGRTYFVMELVKGLAITRYCDECKLSIRQRLELFIPVCQAIQHAHQKGIIHRDLKPSNVMVAEYDSKPIPKVIDFGVAKAVNQQLTAKTVFTHSGQIVGTVEYMSPEQSRINPLDIDTRSDIYSLGVLLYELITGSTPIQSQQVKDLGWDELARMIRESDASPPSQRLRSTGDVQGIAHQRSTDSKRLVQLVEGELDWIVLKALEKQRSDRYQSPLELAQDIQRFLQGQVVLACPPSLPYRLRKYVDKHRVAIATGGLVAAALVFGVCGTVWQAWRASVARTQAEQQRDIARSETQRAQDAETKAQLEALRSAKEAEITRAVASFVNNDLIAFADPNLEPDRDIRLREIIDRASSKITSLHAAPLVEASIRYTLAKSYLGLGEYRSALQHAEVSWRIRKEILAESHLDTLASQLLVAEAELKLSRFGSACEKFATASEICQQSMSEDASMSLECLHGYGVGLMRLGKLDTAMSTLENVLQKRNRIFGTRHEKTLETEREIAELLIHKGEYPEASRAFKRVLAIMTEHLGDSHLLTLKTMAGAANVATELGEFADAKTQREAILARQTRVLGETHPDTMLTACSLSLVAEPNREPGSAIAKNTELMKIAEEKFGSSHAVTQSIATTLADLLMEQGRTSEAIQYLKQAELALSNLHEGANPDGLRIQFRIASCLVFEGRFTQALAMYHSTLNLQQSLLSPNHLDTVKTHYAYAIALMTSGDYKGAEEHLHRVIDTLLASDLKQHPLLLLAQSKLATLESVLGRVSCLDRHQEFRSAAKTKYGQYSSIGLQLDIAYAESLLRFGRTLEAKGVLEANLEFLHAHFAVSHPIRGQMQDALIEALASSGEFAAAITQSQELYDQRSEQLGPQHPLTFRSQNQLGALLVQSGKPVEGAALIQQALEGCRRCLGSEFPLTLTYQQNLASTLGVIAINDRTKRQETLDLFENLLATQETWGVDHPDWLFSQLGYAGALGQQGRSLQAEKVFESLLPKLIRMYGAAHPITLRCRENYSAVLGSSGKYEEAIVQCRAYLQEIPEPGVRSTSHRKIVHAAIEYYISSGNILLANDLFETALQLAGEPQAGLDWFFVDLPFFTDALIKAGDVEKTREFLEKSSGLFKSKLGPQHPQSLFVRAKLVALYLQLGRTDSVKLLVRELAADSDGSEDKESLSTAFVFAQIAKRFEAKQVGLQVVALYGMASTPEANAMPAEYQALAIKALGQLAQQGQLRSQRALQWLKHSADLDSLRQREDFQQILAEAEQAVIIERIMRLSWNLAIVGDHQQATATIEELATDDPAVFELGVVQYLSARTWARCLESANRQGQGALASEYLKKCEASLEKCEKLGFLKSDADQLNLMNDENFITVRDKISIFARYSTP